MSEFPYEHGSDLHHLWGWGDRLRARIDADDDIPIGTLKEREPAIFRPHRAAADAMQRLGKAHYIAIKQVDDALTWANTAFDAFLSTPSDSTRSKFADELEILCHRIETAVAAIAPPPAANLTPEEKTILETLAREHPMLVTQAELTTALNVAPNTTGKYVNALLERNLIDQPRGPRKGYGLTEAGRLLTK